MFLFLDVYSCVWLKTCVFITQRLSEAFTAYDARYGFKHNADVGP